MRLDARLLSEATRSAVADAWARTGQLEHASIAAFARFALQLLQLGAPPDLLTRTAEAMADETRHAQLAFGVASALSGTGRGPAELDISDCLLETSLLEVTRLVIREGCLGETTAALEALEAAALAEQPALARLLTGNRGGRDAPCRAGVALRRLGPVAVTGPSGRTLGGGAGSGARRGRGAGGRGARPRTPVPPGEFSPNGSAGS